ncbi:MAG: 16S rRNA processing protein RimM [Alphaproteobacteria bacterium]|nr:16S rRNA processing protein RimM [Alphaproteobacteria bacterium]
MTFQNTDQPPKRICIGKIVAAHGVKGLVKILSFGDDTELLNGTIYIDESGEKSLSITLKNKLGKYILAEIKEITDRTQAEKLRGIELFIDKSTLPALKDEDSFYFEDLIGLDVIESDKIIGTILSVKNFGAGDLLEIRLSSGKDFFLPFLKETVPEINIKDGVLKIKNYQIYAEE